jgi:carbon-monoxide dehydrogenase medium subunit
VKPAGFEYHAPLTTEAAVALLTALGEDGKVLAGGQSLVPTMAFRLARPGALVDINRIAALDFCLEEGGVLRVGALTRHARFEKPVAPGVLGRLLPEMARNIAHTPIRSRGTMCGSLAHADPASEWCCMALALGAVMVTRSQAGERHVPVQDWFRSVFTTALRPDELLAEVRLPALREPWRAGFNEFNRRAGDFALAMCVALLRLEGGRVAEARLALGGVAATPILARDAALALTGRVPGEEAWQEAAALAANCFEPSEDATVAPEYRRDLVRAVVKRALRQAAA